MPLPITSGDGSAPDLLPYPNPNPCGLVRIQRGAGEDGPGDVLFGMACPDWLFSWQYAVWLVLWVGWNAFIICFYLEVGRLSQVTPPPSSFHPTSLPLSILLPFLFYPPSLSILLALLLSFLLLFCPLHSSAPQKGTQNPQVPPPWQQSTLLGAGVAP